MNGEPKIMQNVKTRLLLFIIISLVTTSGLVHEDHGEVEMGTDDACCDTGQDNLEVDWPETSDEYVCTEDKIAVNRHRKSLQSCVDNREMPQPLHVCMSTKIVYNDIPPRGGPHRPHWPVFGEYKYIPPQRWLHSMEHGGVIFLYHPCTQDKEVEKVRSLVRSCLRKHIITPSRMVRLHYPMVLLTWGCKLEFTRLDKEVAINFIRTKAMDPNRTNEYNLSFDGTYNKTLLVRAQEVDGSEGDSNRCPKPHYHKEHKCH